jgi:hypothetical protein
MNQRDSEFELWWNDEDNEFVRDRVFKKDAKEIWDSAFKAGGARPWWSITQEQWAVLNKKLGGGE